MDERPDRRLTLKNSCAWEWQKGLVSAARAERLGRLDGFKAMDASMIEIDQRTLPPTLLAKVGAATEGFAVEASGRKYEI